MRKLPCLAAITLLSTAAAGAAVPTGAPRVAAAVRHGASRPLAEIGGQAASSPAATTTEGRDIPIRIPEALRRLAEADEAPDALRQSAPGTSAPAPLVDFEGFGSDDNLALFGTRMAPPDTQGDVGPNHYVQWNNLGFIIFDKNGARLLGPVAGNSLWTGFGGPCESDNAGDPIVLYDHLAQRWLFSQFVSDSTSDGHQCVALSQGPDPTGAYWLYDFVISPGAFNDYPKIGLWPDGYYLSVNEFVGSTFSGTRVVALERDAMLNGNPARQVDFFLASGAATYFSVQPAHLEGSQTPAAGTANSFVMACDDEVWNCNGAAGGDDGYHVWSFHVDWTTPAGSSFVHQGLLPAGEFSSSLCSFYPCVPQPGTSQRLDALGQFTMYRAQYRNFGSHESIVVSHTVDVDGVDTAGVRWAELRRLFSGAWTLRQEGSFAPADGVHRWMPSAAMDGAGNICVLYSASDGSSVYPSLRYACHESGMDPLGSLGSESICVSGSGSQTGSNRWGDYATLSVDPTDDCSFWGAGEYVAIGGSYLWNSRICSFAFDTCQCDAGTIVGAVTVSKVGDPIEGARIQAGPQRAALSDAGGNYSVALCEGSYDLSASRYGYVPQTVIAVPVAAGDATLQDFSLSPAGEYTLSGTISDGGCTGWPLYAKVEIDHEDPAGDQVVFSDPATGAYAATVVDAQSYSITVTAMIGGFHPLTIPLTVVGDDIVLDLALLPDDSCTAPGYGRPGLVVDEDFDSGWPPAGWSIIDNEGGSPVLWTDLASCGEGGNFTIGAASLACASSDAAGVAEFDTELWTPTFDLGAATTATLSFSANYQNFSGSDFFAVDLSTDGGGAWSNLLTWNEDHGSFRAPPGEDVTIDLAAAGASGSNNLVRFHYFDPAIGEHDWYVQIDDVAIGNASCECTDGGLHFGQVSDANTGTPLDGALLRTDTGHSAVSRATPEDPARGDGFYLLWVPETSSTISVSAPFYGDRVEPVAPASGPVEHAIALPAAMLALSPSTIAYRIVAGGGPASAPLTLSNSGGVAGSYELVEFNTDAVAAVPTVAAQPTGDPSWREQRETDPAAWLAATARNAATAAGVAPTPAIGAAPTGSGELLASYPATGSSWGIGLDRADGALAWLGDLSALGAGGSDRNVEFTLDPAWAATGRAVDWSGLGIPWMADMAFNARTGSFWQVDVGGSNCIREFDPIALEFTGDSICPAFTDTMRGLAYDPVSDSFFAGTWRSEGYIVRFDGAGALLGRWDNGWPVSGLAYNPTTAHLFALANTDALLDLLVFDASDPTLPALYGFASGMGAFSQAGLAVDCDGALWAVDQSSQVVRVLSSGEDGVCDVFGLPWFDFAVPATGELAAASQLSSAATADPAGMVPGCYGGLLRVDNDTPYGAAQLTVGARVDFADSSSDDVWIWAHPFIHGLADAGISSGCGGGAFCADDPLQRAEAAVWLLASREGAAYQPPPASGLVFDDVGSSTYGAPFIEELEKRGISAGSDSCSGVPGPPFSTYCPDDALHRAHLARMLLLTLEDPGYLPPACVAGATRSFTDVAAEHPECRFIEEAHRRGLVSGSGRCSTLPGPPFATFCPDLPVSRAEMATYLGLAFDSLTPCHDPTAPADPTGACLMARAHCACEILSPLQCGFVNEGSYLGDDSSCTSVFCDDFESGDLAAWSTAAP